MLTLPAAILQSSLEEKWAQHGPNPTNPTEPYAY